MDYARRIFLDLDHDQALPKVNDALETHGSGNLTGIDMQTTLEENLGEDIKRYAILGARNPSLLHCSLEVTRDIGLLLPAGSS